MIRMDQRVVDKFWACVERQVSGCWLWTGHIDKRGLPNIRTGGRKDAKEYSARRISLELSGQLFDTKHALNTCGNKLCVNPSHLVSGDAARFFSKVTKFSEKNGGCWHWNDAPKNQQMYGEFRICENGKRFQVSAHVYSWELHNNFKVRKGMVVMHSCDHPWCVNPDHLSLGTAKDNSQDMVVKGRSLRGERNRAATLTGDKVREIRKLFALGTYTKLQLSKLFGVSRTTIRYIVTGRTWKHII